MRKSKITAETSDRVQSTNSSVHNETRIKTSLLHTILRAIQSIVQVRR